MLYHSLCLPLLRTLCSYNIYFVVDFDEASALTARDGIKKLQSQFKTIVRSIKMALIDQDESGDLELDAFKSDFCLDMPESTRDQIQLYIDKKNKAIINSTSYDELFMVLNGCWDYLNPYLLEHIVINYGEEHLRSEMEDYLKDLEIFMNSTTISDFLEALPHSHKRSSPMCPPLDMKKVVTKHKLSGVSTLQCIENIRIELCASMRLTRFSLYIVNFSMGSVIIVWYVTARVAEMFANLERGEDENFVIIEG